MKCKACNREVPESKISGFTPFWKRMFFLVRGFYWVMSKERFDHGFREKYSIQNGDSLCSRCKALLIGIAGGTIAMFATAAILVVIANN